MTIALGILAILFPLFVGWRVWKFIDRGAQVGDEIYSESLGTLLKKVGITSLVTLTLLFACFFLLERA
ncbi:MAG: hypothetical protein EBT03_08880 [Betaproteobacteria bacterium]|nr:hypothetical protein [Betaproteobacteria bacterium]NBT75890.1 hypothetical protein [Betaproteobacteria bacterium]NBY14645.1 hypothetical protein [Betaproteobacteria bacterium]NCA17207.1 hypothetical protein [Betaproteobacteria bacterium]NDF04286.1 hypothetical protein [Betaproteobacteria bacterium]